MKQIIQFCFFIFYLVQSNNSFGQIFNQTIKGRVIDEQSQSSIPGAGIIIKGSNPIISATSDPEGYFKIEHIPIGRVTLLVTSMGFQPQIIPNLNLTSGKEIVLTIELKEEVTKLKEVVINKNSDKAFSLNNMATVSARAFSIEESQRYAGARNDVARMAVNFAGVSTANDAVNDIVIRGNTPNGLLWRLDGIDIPNPNHFGGMGATGGPVSMLNNNVLANSNFMTGAFPAEYGDALSGVFDLKMRNGNYEKHEFLGQVGLNGFEFGAEGPISKKNHSSYLINYRYSTLGVFAMLGISVGTGSAIPKYQDLSFKINMPTNKCGTFSLFSLAGINSIDFVKDFKDSSKNKEEFYTGDYQNIYSKNKMGVVGLSHTYLFNAQTYSKLTLATSGIVNSGIVDSVDFVNKTITSFIRQNYQSTQLLISFFINHKFNAKNNLKVGLNGKEIVFDLLDSVYKGELKRFKTTLNAKGNTFLLQPYICWQFRPTNDITFNAGVNFQYLFLNKKFSPEPRLNAKWQLNGKQSISIGYGLHSKMIPLQFYFNQVLLNNGNYVEPNKNLDFIKSHHFVLSYNYNFSNTLHFKIETYYQYIFQSVVASCFSTFSMLNSSSFNTTSFPDSLKNGGKGRNYGVEFTLEKFMEKGFYALLTTSLFRSQYEGSNGELRSTAFDGRYVVNLLGGKEFALNPHKEKVKMKKFLIVDGKLTAAGGQCYTPINLIESQKQMAPVYDESMAYSKQFKDYFRADFRIAFRLDSKKVSHEMAFDIQNITNHKNPLYMNYNMKNGTEQIVYQLGLFPMMQYRMTF